MGKALTQFFTKDQKIFLDEVKKDSYLTATFYLTGGTALSACYLNHRLSEDVDLFSEKPFDELELVTSVKKIVSNLKLKSELTKIHGRFRYDFNFSNNSLLKVDFVHYDFEHIERTNSIDKLVIDSIGDIAVNKLLSISQRIASKDFVDLYFLLKKYTTWDLQRGVEHKFKLEIEPFYLSSLFTQVENLTDMPIMKKRLTLEELKSFFLAEAKKLALPMLKP